MDSHELCSGEDDGVIYIKIIVATCAGDTTTTISYEDHSSNGLTRMPICFMPFEAEISVA
jgi:hypothetical protein